MINYYCPGFYENQIIYKKYLELQNQYPECFYNNVKITTVYGCFPNVIWNGGGNYLFGSIVDLKTIYKIFQWYCNKNITLQLTFTNTLIKKEDLFDRYSNAILDIANNFPNIEILISSPIIENYIREKYPNIKINKSIIGILKESYNFQTIQKDLNKYNKIVLPRELNKNINFLKQIKNNQRNKIEILVNDPCPIDCPRISSHYDEFSKMQLFEQKSGTARCNNYEKICSPFIYHNTSKYNITYNQLKYYEKEGFSEIKISGRLNPIKGIINNLYYFIKPEYQQDVLIILFSLYIHPNQIQLDLT